eukprot:TRINITY_DN487_c0_g1_i4.p3 TRINITY_DN487_c0_g1~~TRINITY_DN487_c0_g1_i4.p3  ORF type:complete len:318 (+),score=77.92 TRINITY_DN487_c0_g1_i4:105-956(+)
MPGRSTGGGSRSGGGGGGSRSGGGGGSRSGGGGGSSQPTVGWPTRADGQRDMRYTSKQVLASDGTRDRRYTASSSFGGGGSGGGSSRGDGGGSRSCGGAGYSSGAAAGARSTGGGPPHWPTRADGQQDERYTMPQALASDGTRDRRFAQPDHAQFGQWEPLVLGKSKFYEGQDVRPGQHGVYQLGTVTPGAGGRPRTRYVGMDSHLGSRAEAHARGDTDIGYLVDRTQNLGQDLYVRYAPARSRLEQRAQEKEMLDTRLYSWNKQDNVARFHGERTADGRPRR